MTELLLTLIGQAAGPEVPGAGGPGGAPGGAAGALLGSPMIMMVLMFAVIYFMMIRPQQKRQKEHDAFLQGLKNGDRVITSGGIHGTIAGLADGVVTLEIAKNTRVRINRGQIAGPQQKADTSEGDAKAGGKAKADADAKA